MISTLAGRIIITAHSAVVGCAKSEKSRVIALAVPGIYSKRWAFTIYIQSRSVCLNAVIRIPCKNKVNPCTGISKFCNWCASWIGRSTRPSSIIPLKMSFLTFLKTYRFNSTTEYEKFSNLSFNFFMLTNTNTTQKKQNQSVFQWKN